MKRLLFVFFCVSMLLFGICKIAGAATSFDTTPSWDGSSFISTYGTPNTSTYGETFIAPSDNVLQDFTFYISPMTGVTLSSKAYVYAWNGSLFGAGGGGATGSALFASPGSIITAANGNFNAVTVNTGGVALNPGSQYVMFLTVSNPTDYSATTGGSGWGVISGSHVPNDGGGGFVFYNNGNNPALLNTTPWDNFADFGDLAFKANFTGAAVPEPCTTLLLGAGLVGLAAFRKKFRAV